MLSFLIEQGFDDLAIVIALIIIIVIGIIGLVHLNRSGD